MNSKKIDKYLKENCSHNRYLLDLLNELYLFQLEDRGWWKDDYKKIIKKYSGGQRNEN